MLFRKVKPSTEPDSAREQVDLTDLVRILYRRRRVVASVVAAGTILAAAAVYVLPPYYRATAVLGLEGADPKVFDVEAVLENKPQDKPSIATHVEFLSSSAFMREMATALNLDADPEFTDTTPVYLKLASAAVAWLPAGWPISVSLADSLAQPPLDAGTLREVATEQLQQRTWVQQVNDAYVVAVQVGSYDAGKAARIANAITQAYVGKQYEFKRHATARAVDWLNERVAELREQLVQADRAVASYKQQTGFIEGNQDSPVLRQLDQLGAQLVVAQSNRAQAEARLAQIEALRRSGDGLASAAQVVTSPLLVQLRQEAGQINRQAADLSKEFGPRHPQILGLLASLEDVRRRERDEVQRIISDLTNEATVARQLESQLRLEIAKLSDAATTQEDVAVPLRQLEREATATDALYQAFLGRAKELEEQLQIVDAGVEIVSEAAAPLRPSFPVPILFVGAGLVGSSVLGILAAFTAELFDTGMRTGHQLRRVTGLPTLALVPKIRVRKDDRRFPLPLIENGQSLYAEAVRGIRLELLFSNVDRPARAVLVTSALPGEGKTTLAISLAAAAAQHGQQTILVDLDLHRPRLRRLVRPGKNQPDLVDYLIGRSTLEEAIVLDRDGGNLDFITVARTPANPSALLGSQKMAALLHELRERYDFVVLDLPPVLAVNDARILATQVDAVLFVVQWGKTKEEAARAGVELLQDRNIPLVGAVLNQVDLKRHAKAAYGDGLQYYRKYKTYYNRAA